VDTSALTAIGNDYGFDQVFARQVTAIGRPGDILFALSTSGRSKNVVSALAAARQRGLATVAVTGNEVWALSDADIVLTLPAASTPKIQELTLTATHIIFALVEQLIFPVS
jgi:D-sedoheptulose 7-phosphate isomerase